MRLPLFLSCLFGVWSPVFADIKFTTPAAGTSVPGGVALTVTWAEGGTAPLISDLSGYVLRLYSGSNDAPIALLPLVEGGTFAKTPTSVSATIPVTIGGSAANAYFLGMESTATSGGYIINYSSRFTLTGVIGIFPDDIKTALGKVTGVAGPALDKTHLVAGAAAGAAGNVQGAGQYAIPYPEQTGLTKYAPMQPVPPKSITADNTSPLWPSSSVVIAKSLLPPPKVATTIIQSATASFASHANTAAAASQPADDMEKYLNRWKD